MRDKSILIIIAVVIVGTVALATGFEKRPNGDSRWLRRWEAADLEPQGELQPGRREGTVSAEGAQEADIRIRQAVGELSLRGGATELMEATFDTSRSSWLPSVTYDVDGTRGDLRVLQDERLRTGPGRFENDWAISLNSSIPVDLDIERGVGEGTIDLSAVNVRELRARLGVGDTTIDLSGDRTDDVDASIETGVGEATLILPARTGVRLRVERGIGDISVPDGLTSRDGYWVNAAYTPGQPVVEVTVKHGIGDLNIELR